MKKKIILFTSSIVLLSAAVMSYRSGPISMLQGNRTGSQGSTANCSTGSGCHSVNGSNTSVFISLGDSVTGMPINGGWEPGKTYKLSISGASPGKSKYGFQLSAVYFDGTSEVQAGTFSGVTGNAAIKTSGNLSIVEHTDTMNLVMGAYLYTMFWTAPPAGTMDTIKFYATVNGVNADLSSSGDVPNNKMVAYHKHTTSVSQLNANIKINAYPNPMTDKLNISLEGADKGEYTINVFDVTGKVVSTQNATINGTFSTTINSSGWASGMYHVQVKQGEAQKVIAVMK